MMTPHQYAGMTVAEILTIKILLSSMEYDR